MISRYGRPATHQARCKVALNSGLPGERSDRVRVVRLRHTALASFIDADVVHLHVRQALREVERDPGEQVGLRHGERVMKALIRGGQVRPVLAAADVPPLVEV